MMERRWPWLAASGLLIAAGLAAAVATWLWWLPCRGQMLYGVHVVATPESATFTDACLRRMDEGTAFPAPGYGLDEVPGLLFCSVITVVLTGVAWLVPALTQPIWALRQPARLLARIVLLLPGLLVVTLGLVVAVRPEAGSQDAVGASPATALSMILLDAVALAVLVAVPVVAAMRIGERSVRWLLAGLALCSFSIVGVIADYAVMGVWSETNWDAPPGSGYPTAVWLVLCGAAIIAVSRVIDAPSDASAPPTTEQVEQVDPVA